MSFAEPRFDLTEEAIDERTHVISVGGEVHVSTAPDFSRRLNEAIAKGATAVVMDLSETEFIDSTGLSVMLNGLRRVTRRRGRMAVVVTNPTVRRLFEITRLDSTFDIHTSREDAIHAVQAATGPYDPDRDDSAAGTRDGAP